MYHVFSFLVSKGFAACLNIGSHVILDFAVFPCKSFEQNSSRKVLFMWFMNFVMPLRVGMKMGSLIEKRQTQPSNGFPLFSWKTMVRYVYPSSPCEMMDGFFVSPICL